MPLTVGSLFSGIEGIGLGLEAAGMTIAWQCEADPQCRELLAQKWPEVPCCEDVRTLDGSQVARVDVLCGGSPCFVAGTLILTWDGYRPIEDIEVGDLVLTHEGRWQPVMRVGSRWAPETVVVKAMGSPEVVTTPEHPILRRDRELVWSTAPRGYRRRFGDACWTEAGKLIQGDMVCQVLPIEGVQDDQGTDFWWMVGRFLADGWVTNGVKPRVTICCARAEAADVGERIGRVFPACRVEAGPIVKYQITRVKLARWLLAFGQGATNKRLPGWCLALAPDSARALLLGYLSGDGHYDQRSADGRTSPGWRATTVSRSLALGMALLAQRVWGVVASIHEHDVAPTTVIQGRTVRQHHQYSVHIKRRNKEAFVDGSRGWKPVRYVRTGQPARRVFDLEVAVDHSYVADGLVVHNCTDWSVAGKRAGLAGERTGLFYDFARIAREVAPRWLLFENVVGLLSACSCPECGPVTAEEGDDDPDAVRLPPVPEHRGWDFSVVLAELTGYHPAPPEGGWRNTGVCAGPLRTVCWRVLDARFFGVPQRRRRVFLVGHSGDPASAAAVLLEPDCCDGNPPPRREAGQGVAALTANGVGTRGGPDNGGVPPAVAYSEPVVFGFSHTQGIDAQPSDESFPTLRREGGGHAVAIPIQHAGAIERSQNGLGVGTDGDPMYTLDGLSQHAVAYQCQGTNVGEMGTLRRGNGTVGSGVPFVAVSENQRGEVRETDESASLTNGGGKPGQGHPLVRGGMAVRRLTPLECERLQGLPDGHTEGFSDSVRYRMLGNAVCAAVSAWIGRRIVTVDESTRRGNSHG